MGCILSSVRDEGGTSHAQGTEVIVFAPGMRVPKSEDFANALHPHVPIAIVDRLSYLRTRIIAMAGEEPSAARSRSKRKTATQHGGTTITDIQQALEDYLPLLLGLLKEGGELTNSVQFVWTNQEDSEQETSMLNAYYELLSLLHLMAVVGLIQANVLLSRDPPGEGYQAKTREDNRKEAIDVLLKVSGILECARNSVMPKMSGDLKAKLPADLREGVLSALSMQALGQGVEIQLGLAIDNLKATLAVKRRLACEQVKYWQQAHDNIQNVHVGGVWGGKHRLYVKWKLAEAKAAAYYYHGLILDEGNEEDTHAKAVLCLQTAEACLKESQRLCADFCSECPSTRLPPLWGAVKYLSEKIPRDLASRMQTLKSTYRHERIPDRVSDLPDFPLSLHSEEFYFPRVDPLWEL